MTDDEDDFQPDPEGPAERASLLRERHQALKDRKAAEINRRSIAVAKVADVANATDVAAAVESIDRDTAKALLAQTRGNRPLRRQHIEWLATLMRTGQWRLTHQGVALSVTGRLLDGHHRLEAVVLSGITVPMLVIRGLPDETWEAIDCGVTRAVHDRIALVSDTRHNRRIVEIIQQMMRIEKGARGKMTADDVTKEWKALREALTKILAIMPSPIMGITRAQVLGAIARYHERSPLLALDFARVLAVSASRPEDEGHPARALRAWLLDCSGFAGGSKLAEQLYWTTVAALYEHHQGNKIASVTALTVMEAWWPR